MFPDVELEITMMPLREVYIGVDPGDSSGCIAALVRSRGHGAAPVSLPLAKATLRDRVNWLDGLLGTGPELCFAVLEDVHSMPKQGVTSSFKFGWSKGSLEMALVACGISYELVSPQKWQLAMGCRSKGDKNITKAAAQRLFPEVKVIHHTADALLLAEYARRLVISRQLKGK